MAGLAGIEPANAGVKVPCLTAWLQPCILHNYPQHSASDILILPGLVQRQPEPHRLPSCTVSCRLSGSIRPPAAGYHGTFHSLRRCRRSEPFSLFSREQLTLQSVVLPLSHRAQERLRVEGLHSMTPQCGAIHLEPLAGIEPAPPVWKTGVLPLNYSGIYGILFQALEVPLRYAGAPRS